MCRTEPHGVVAAVAAIDLQSERVRKRMSGSATCVLRTRNVAFIMCENMKCPSILTHFLGGTVGVPPKKIPPEMSHLFTPPKVKMRSMSLPPRARNKTVLNVSKYVNMLKGQALQ